MTTIDYSEIVSLLIAGRPEKRLSFADAVREIIAFPQKPRDLKLSIRYGRSSMRSYKRIVAIFNRRDFPD